MNKITYLLLCIIIILVATKKINADEINNVFGGKLIRQNIINEELELVDNTKLDSTEQNKNIERYFRPSSTAILNDANIDMLEEFYGENPYKINLPSKPFKSGKDTVINYFSVLREAANPTQDTNTGCGTIGNMSLPYPIAYNFLSKTYQDKLSYDEFLDSFKNMLHINLIKVKNIPPDEDKKDLIKYFVELEVIEGTDEEKGVFSYYYGDIYIKKEGENYKIVDMNYTPENYLCAPYHGWNYDAKDFVEVEYGNWCSFIEGEVIVNQQGYEKKVYYKDKEDNEYFVLFYELTNGVDKKIADYKKNKDDEWDVVYINPYKCLKNKQKNG